MKTEGIKLNFKPDSVEKIAETATEINEHTENIGARRLYTIMEKLLDDISFKAPEMSDTEVTISAEYVEKQLHEFVEDEDLSRYIL